MRLQNIIMSMLVTLAVLTVLSGMVIDLENEWGVSNEQLFNNSGNASVVLDTLNIYNNEHQQLMNASQYAPNGADADIGDSTSGTTSTASSSLQMAYKFVTNLWTVPKLIINTLGTFFGIDPIFLNTMVIWLIIVVVFLIAGSVFFQKL